MKSIKITTVFAVLALMLVCSIPGQAIPINANGTFGFTATGGSVSYTPPPPGGLLVNATTVSIPVPNLVNSLNCGIGTNICEQINTLPVTYLGIQNDFSPLGTVGHTPLANNQDVSFTGAGAYTFDLSFLTLPTFVFSFEVSPSNRFTFTASSGSKSTATLGGTDFLNIQYLGLFSDSGGTYNTTAASLSLTFTQTGGSTGALNFAGTFATPPTGGAPEPATMALMGSALVGLGLIGRKRMARK